MQKQVNRSAQGVPAVFTETAVSSDDETIIDVEPMQAHEQPIDESTVANIAHPVKLPPKQTVNRAKLSRTNKVGGAKTPATKNIRKGKDNILFMISNHTFLHAQCRKKLANSLRSSSFLFN